MRQPTKRVSAQGSPTPAGALGHWIMRTTFSVLTLCAAATAVTHAQAPPRAGAVAVDDVRKDARIHFGPLYVTPTVLLKNLGVDTNVFNQAGEQKKDFTFTVTPKAEVWIPIARRALITNSVATDIVWYATYGSERSVNPELATRAEVYFNRLTLFGANTYLNTRERANFEIDLRSRHLENDTTAGVALQLTPKLSVEAAAVRGITRYDADAYFDGMSLRQALNHDTTGYRLGASHRLTPLTTLALRYESLEDRFPYAASRDADSFRVMPGVEFKPRALIAGTAYVGYRRFTPQAPGQLPEFSGLVSRLGLSYTLLGATTMGVSYQRDLTYSYETLQPFFVDDSVGASIRRALGRRFDVLASADRHNYSYKDLPVPASAVTGVPQRTDTTWAYTGSVRYRVGRDGRVGLAASYFDRQSTTRQFRSFDGLRIGTVFTLGL
jgi:hypothetical protein